MTDNRNGGVQLLPGPSNGLIEHGLASGLAWALTLLTLRRIGRVDRKGDATVAAVIGAA